MLSAAAVGARRTLRQLDTFRGELALLVSGRHLDDRDLVLLRSRRDHLDHLVGENFDGEQLAVEHGLDLAALSHVDLVLNLLALLGNLRRRLLEKPAKVRMWGLPDALRADGEVGLDHAERDADGVLVLAKLEVLLGLELEVVSLLITRVAILEQLRNPYCDLDARGHGASDGTLSIEHRRLEDLAGGLCHIDDRHQRRRAPQVRIARKHRGGDERSGLLEVRKRPHDFQQLAELRVTAPSERHKLQHPLVEARDRQVRLVGFHFLRGERADHVARRLACPERVPICGRFGMLVSITLGLSFRAFRIGLRFQNIWRLSLVVELESTFDGNHARHVAQKRGHASALCSTSEASSSRYGHDHPSS